jgi:hypothetical protein
VIDQPPDVVEQAAKHEVERMDAIVGRGHRWQELLNLLVFVFDDPSPTVAVIQPAHVRGTDIPCGVWSRWLIWEKRSVPWAVPQLARLRYDCIARIPSYE